jgi:hypothetical protein
VVAADVLGDDELPVLHCNLYKIHQELLLRLLKVLRRLKVEQEADGGEVDVLLSGRCAP